MAAVSFTAPAHAAPCRSSVEVVVTLDAPPLAQAIQRSRVLSAARRRRSGSNLRSADEHRVRPLARDRAVARSPRASRPTIPGARVTWRYQVVLDGLAVVAPARRARAAVVDPRRREGLAERHLPPAARPQPRADRRRPAVGRAEVRHGGQRDQDRDHRRRRRPGPPVLQPDRLHDAARLPEGEHDLHDRKVIVARAFAPPTNNWQLCARPVRPRVLRARDPRRRDRRRRLLARRDRRTAARSPAWPRTRTSATTRC